MTEKRHLFLSITSLFIYAACLLSCNKSQDNKVMKPKEAIFARDSTAVESYLQQSYNLRVKDSINGSWKYSDMGVSQQIQFLISLEKKKDNDSIKGSYLFKAYGKIKEEGVITGIIKEKKMVIEFYPTSYPAEDKGKAELLDWNEKNYLYMNWNLIKSPKKSSVPEKCKLTKFRPSTGKKRGRIYIR